MKSRLLGITGNSRGHGGGPVGKYREGEGERHRPAAKRDEGEGQQQGTKKGGDHKRGRKTFSRPGEGLEEV